MEEQHVKDPNKVRAGKIGSFSRWGPQRRIRLDGMSTEQRLRVLDYIEKVRKAGQR